MIINKFREWVNLGLYDSKVAVLKTFDILKLLGVLVAGGIILYTLGYPLNDDDRLFYIGFIYYLLFFYALNYFIRFLYTFEPRKFLKHTAIELGLIIVVVAQGISALFLESSLIEHICHDLFDFERPIKAMMITLEIILVMILFLDFSKLSSLISILKIDTVWIFILSFLIIIGIGTILLMLPEMSHTPNGASFMKALFTSTSASCVTGLIVCDTATFWTFKGQIVIIVLVQLGGVSILTFATFFATFFAKGMGAKEQSMLQDFFSTDSKSDAREILRSIVFLSILIEAVGAFFIYHSFGSQIQFQSTSHKIYQSIFHSISAFNNSGFSIITDGLYNPALRQQHILHFTMVALVFLGAVGFPALQEFFYPSKIRDRLRFGWKKMNVAARISIYTAVGITLV
ncbi:MAG: hypothetical protein HKN22_06730, partial [Bacteroidia bacterium]|nr:hypothetical protein [Bacteroidia bacterium]